MRSIYVHEHEGVRFSKNGHAAYERGEKPQFLWKWSEYGDLIPTCHHHIEVNHGKGQWKRPLVMFYRKGVWKDPNENHPGTQS